MELSIIIPCYNEEKRITRTSQKIFDYLFAKKMKTEIIFVDDGSIDKTHVVLEGICKKLDGHPLIKTKIITGRENHGKGHAVKTGIIKASGRHILICDADLSTPITELEKLLQHTVRYELVIGSRKQIGAEIIKSQPALREFLGKSYSLMSKIILGVDINDFTCGFKLIKKEAAKEIADRLTINRWAYDSEILKIAKIRNHAIKEVGIIWRDDRGTKVKIMTDVFSSFTDLLKIVANSLLGKYD